jgi:hypothetical protein
VPVLGAAETRQPPAYIVQPARTSLRWWKLATVVLGLALAVMLTLVVQAVVDQSPSRVPAVARTGPAPHAATGATTPDGRVRAQASAVDAILASSAGLHTQVVAAIDAIAACQDPASAAATLAGAGTQRQGLVGRLAGIDWQSLPGGSAMAGALRQSLDASARSDGDYAAWGRDVASSGCTAGQPAPNDASYQAAQASDATASAAKAQFVAQWSPLATSLGLPVRSAAAI